MGENIFKNITMERPGVQYRCCNVSAVFAGKDAGGTVVFLGGSAGSGRGPRWPYGASAHSPVGGNGPPVSPEGSSLLSLPGMEVRTSEQIQAPLQHSNR